MIAIDVPEYPTVCAVCGERAVRLSSEPLRTEFREGAVEVDGFEYEHCDSCGESFIDAAQMDHVQRAAVEAARVRHGRLSSAEIREMRLTLGVTQATLEGQLGVAGGTVGRWERGEELQTRIADNFLRLLSAHPEFVAEAMGAVARESRGPYRPRT